MHIAIAWSYNDVYLKTAYSLKKLKAKISYFDIDAPDWAPGVHKLGSGTDGYYWHVDDKCQNYFRVIDRVTAFDSRTRMALPALVCI